jgi:adenosylhomocysteine nucleosidase
MIGIVVGLAAEARAAVGLGCRVDIGGGGAAGAEAAARRLAESGATALISFGLAGGLAPGMAAGTVRVPVSVVGPGGERWETDPALSRLLGEPSGTILAADDIIGTRLDKHAAHAASGADAADIESGAVARIATEHGLAFAVLRAVCDPADRDLPPAAITALDAAGRIRPAALARSLLRHPGQIGGLIGLGKEAALARKALLTRVATIGALTWNPIDP